MGEGVEWCGGGLSQGYMAGTRTGNSQDKWQCLSVFAFFLCIASILLVQPASSTFSICSALHSFRFLLVHGILSQSDFAASWLGVLVSNCRISQKGN